VIVHIDTGRGRAIVTFAYDVKAIELVKSIPSKRWHRERRYWTIRADDVPLAAKRFADAGHDVRVDGRRHANSSSRSRSRSSRTAHPATKSSDPFAPIFAAVPSDRRPDLYKALARVFHPDAGGDHVLMQQLNDHKEDL
jgi:hypothetical protein